jgi:hypothetical protein
MQVFDPRHDLVPSGHFIGGHLVAEGGRVVVQSARTWDGSRSMPSCASKACPSTSPRRTEVHGRTPKGQTARHAVAAPANRSFGSGGTAFPYIPRATACCNHFVMSLSKFPSLCHL